jgi:hypothetical protein
MNKIEHQAFIFFSKNYPPAIALVFMNLYHWGTIEWKDHKAGDWFYKSAKQTAEELEVNMKTAQKAYEIIKDGHCTIFESKVEKKKNYNVTWIRVVTKNEELSTIHLPIKRVDTYPENGLVSTHRTGRHNHINAYKPQDAREDGSLSEPLALTEEWIRSFLLHCFGAATYQSWFVDCVIECCQETKAILLKATSTFRQSRLSGMLNMNRKFSEMMKEYGFTIEVVKV